MKLFSTFITASFVALAVATAEPTIVANDAAVKEWSVKANEMGEGYWSLKEGKSIQDMDCCFFWRKDEGSADLYKRQITVHEADREKEVADLYKRQITVHEADKEKEVADLYKRQITVHEADKEKEVADLYKRQIAVYEADKEKGAADLYKRQITVHEAGGEAYWRLKPGKEMQDMDCCFFWRKEEGDSKVARRHLRWGRERGDENGDKLVARQMKWGGRKVDGWTPVDESGQEYYLLKEGKSLKDMDCCFFWRKTD